MRTLYSLNYPNNLSKSSYSINFNTSKSFLINTTTIKFVSYTNPSRGDSPPLLKLLTYIFLLTSIKVVFFYYKVIKCCLSTVIISTYLPSPHRHDSSLTSFFDSHIEKMILHINCISYYVVVSISDYFSLLRNDHPYQ